MTNPGSGRPISFETYAAAVYAAYFPKLVPVAAEKSASSLQEAAVERRTRFEARYGAITREFWCENVIACAVLTEKDAFFWSKSLQIPVEVEELLYECDRQQIEVKQFLNLPSLAQERSVAIRSLMDVVTSVLAILESGEILANPDDDDAERRLAHLRRRLKHIESSHERSSQRVAQIYYFRGMVLGVLPVYAVGAALFLVATMQGSSFALKTLALSIASGATGAIVSVLARTTGGNVWLDQRVGWSQLRRLGAFRPVIGAVFGAAIYVLVAGGLIPALRPPEAAEAGFFFSGLAFLAGFSERWAQDMLSLARRTGTPQEAAGVRKEPEG